MSADNWTKCPKCGKDLREDYELGIDEDTFGVRYRGACVGDGNLPHKDRVSCGFRFEHNHTEKVAK